MNAPTKEQVENLLRLESEANGSPLTRHYDAHRKFFAACINLIGPLVRDWQRLTEELELSNGCLVMIYEALQAIDPSDRDTQIPPMLYPEWICGIVGRKSLHIAELEAELAAARERIAELTSEWSVMARACGNWREWPGSATPDDHDHDDWKCAARAIIERDALRAEVDLLKRGIAPCVDEDGTPFASARAWREAYRSERAEVERLRSNQ